MDFMKLSVRLPIEDVCIDINKDSSFEGERRTGVRTTMSMLRASPVARPRLLIAVPRPQYPVRFQSVPE
jgi:hypothetical protein